MNEQRINISRNDIFEAHKEYIKWTKNIDNEIPSSVTKQIKNTTKILDAYGSQIKIYGREAILKWDLEALATYAICNFLALKFRKALIKIWDKEYPKHLEESLEAAKDVLLDTYKYNFDEAAKDYDDPNAEKDSFKPHSTEIRVL